VSRWVARNSDLISCIHACLLDLACVVYWFCGFVPWREHLYAGAHRSPHQGICCISFQQEQLHSEKIYCQVRH
jgi:hypothetical protein